MSRERRVRGFAMPVVIALIVVFATILGTSLVTLSSAQHVGFGLDLQGVRAYHASRAGLEWGMYHVLRTGYGGCTGINGQSVVFSGGLLGFRANLACSESSHEEGSPPNVALYTVTSTACNAGSCPVANPPSGYVERQLRATLAK